jgi:hypothetical protein
MTVQNFVLRLVRSLGALLRLNSPSGRRSSLDDDVDEK